MKLLLTTLNAKYVHSNLALRYLFAVAKEHLRISTDDDRLPILNSGSEHQITACGSRVEMREFTINNDMSYIYNEIIRGDYDMVCFSCYIWNIEKTKEIASWVKKAMPQTVIVFGGPEVSFETESFLRENLWCDYVVRGEGELPFGYIFDKIRQNADRQNADRQSADKHGADRQSDDRQSADRQGADKQSAGRLSVYEILKNCPGISYLSAAAARQGCDPPVLMSSAENYFPAEYIEIPQAAPQNMDEVPFPYEAGKIEKDKVVYYESSRGCPYRCSYCLSSIEKTVRPRSLELTLKELDFFLKEKVKQVKFIDRTFNFDKKRAFQIWEHLIKNDNGITNFHFEICAELMDDEIFQLLETARTGLFQFEIGIQSTNRTALAAVNRHNDVNKITQNVKKLVAAGNSHVHVDLIAGLPCEDFESFTRSFDEVYRFGADNLQLGFLKLLKGTGIRSGISDSSSDNMQSTESGYIFDADSFDASKRLTGENHGYVYRDKAPYEIIKNNYISARELMKLKMVETVLELYANKPGFPGSISLLIDAKGQGPFAFFMDLAEFFFANGYQNRSHKKEDLYRILYKYACSQADIQQSWSLRRRTADEEYAATGEEYAANEEYAAPGDEFSRIAKTAIYRDLELSMNFDAVKKFDKKGWEI